ncbi:hypothetical protein PsYK624_028930 [Phanerochaete sordida]|uniref:Uncharacterized protein n=1 Tax=Phanerochaete sordida TaxID=48140 RepID=A0A9P3G2Q9_9APHY|nr:hypothetical protein PsYK624_028930 [Phanerochaete sordida]
MPRRPPPTPLRLHQGPLPARGKPKHTLPSLPRPAFHLPLPAVPGAAPRARAPSVGSGEHNLQTMPPGELPGRPSFGSSRASTDSVRSPVSPPSRAGSDASEPVRGPWDHSASIKVAIDISAVLPPPQPAALPV